MLPVSQRVQPGVYTLMALSRYRDALVQWDGPERPLVYQPLVPRILTACYQVVLLPPRDFGELPPVARDIYYAVALFLQVRAEHPDLIEKHRGPGSLLLRPRLDTQATFAKLFADIGIDGDVRYARIEDLLRHGPPAPVGWYGTNQQGAFLRICHTTPKIRLRLPHYGNEEVLQDGYRLILLPKLAYYAMWDGHGESFAVPRATPTGAEASLPSGSYTSAPKGGTDAPDPSPALALDAREEPEVTSAESPELQQGDGQPNLHSVEPGSRRCSWCSSKCPDGYISGG